MVVFRYRARGADGRSRKGDVEAQSESEAITRLRGQGLVVSELAEAAPSRPGAWDRFLQELFPVRSIDVELGLQQISFLLESGVSLLVALVSVADQAGRRSVAVLWRRVADRVLAGEGFSAALRLERAIPDIATAMAAVGEGTGDLGVTLTRAADAMSRRRALRTTLLTALTYPAIVFFLSIGVVAYMMIVLVPKLTVFLNNFGRSMPPMTQALIDAARFTQLHALRGLIIGLGLGAAFLLLRAWHPTRLRIDRALLCVPMLGSLQRLAATGAFARNMGLLLTSGVRLTDSLRTVEPLVLNRWIAATVASARERVLQGVSLTQALSANSAFEPLMRSAVSVGELGGNLDVVFAQVADYHDARLQARIRALSALVEPVIIVVVGGIVGFVYLAFFLAIYSVAGNR